MNLKKQWIEIIKEYEPWDEQEKQDKKVLLKYLSVFDDIFYRENEIAHMTSSPWIINHDASKVLMVYHNIYDSWGWCGGHCDGDEDTLYVAIKEGKEETGLQELNPITDEILAIDILPVPRHKKKGNVIASHVHLNLTYLCMADENEKLHYKPDENQGVRWISVDEIDNIVREKDMIPVYHKLIEKSKQIVTILKTNS